MQNEGGAVSPASLLLPNPLPLGTPRVRLYIDLRGGSPTPSPLVRPAYYAPCGVVRKCVRPRTPESPYVRKHVHNAKRSTSTCALSFNLAQALRMLHHAQPPRAIGQGPPLQRARWTATAPRRRPGAAPAAPMPAQRPSTPICAAYVCTPTYRVLRPYHGSRARSLSSGRTFLLGGRAGLSSFAFWIAA